MLGVSDRDAGLGFGAGGRFGAPKNQEPRIGADFGVEGLVVGRIGAEGLVLKAWQNGFPSAPPKPMRQGIAHRRRHVAPARLLC